MNIENAEQKLNDVYDAAMGQDVPELQAALQALSMMPKDAVSEIKVIDCDFDGNITVDFAGLMFEKKVKKISAKNYVVKGKE